MTDYDRGRIAGLRDAMTAVLREMRRKDGAGYSESEKVVIRRALLDGINAVALRKEALEHAVEAIELEMPKEPMNAPVRGLYRGAHLSKKPRKRRAA